MDRLSLLAENLREPVSAIVTGRPTLKMTLAAGFMPHERNTLLMDFEKYALWTLPSVFPRNNRLNDDYGFDFQGLGAQLTLNLLSKLMMVMFNPGQPFFKTDLTDDQYALLMSQGMAKDDVDVMLASLEKSCIREFEGEGGRIVAMNVMLHAMIVGNAMYEYRDNKHRYFSYRDYDAKFDPWGVMTDAVIRETVTVGDLPMELIGKVMQQGFTTTDKMELYTGVKLIGDKYLVWQELDDILILDDMYGIYNRADLPYSAVRWSTAPKRNAGIGLIEQTAGDWHMFSVLAETDIDLVALLTDILTLVDTRNGNIKLADIEQADTGSYVPGNKDALQSHSHKVEGKIADVQVKAEQVIRRLSQVFLMTSNVIRDSERTTAEEVRIVTQEIGQVHLPVYLTLGDNLQKPIATHKLREKLSALGDVKPTILTGVTNMTRAAELDSHRGAWNDITALGNIPLHVAMYLKMDYMIKQIAAGWGLDYSAAMRTESEVQAEQQRQAELTGQQQPQQ